MTFIKHIFFSLYAAIIGVIVGVGVFSLLGTVQVLVLQRPEFIGLDGLILGPIRIFVSAFVWALIGAAMFVLPQAFLLSFVYAMYFRNKETPESSLTFVTLAMLLFLYLPVFYFGFRYRFVDGVILGIAIFTGVKIAIVVLHNQNKMP